MPIATYVLSYRDTGSILSYCRLEKQTLLNQQAVAALLDHLVGTNLAFSLSTSTGGFTIPKSDLALDELEINDDKVLAAFIREPFKYVLDLTDPTTKLGDGTTKKLGLPQTPQTFNLFSSNPPPATPAHPSNMLAVHFANQLGPPIPAYALLEGQTPVVGILQTPNFDINFSLPALNKNQLYALIFVARGIQPFVGFTQAQ
jgi:hypothetical protein